MTKRLSADYKAWSQPVNMGDSINSPKWDAYFSVDAKGEYGYVAAYQNALGGTDIFRTKLSESQRPKTVVLVYGKVYNAITKEVMDAKLEYNLIPGESNEGNAISSPEGNYKVTLPYGKKYSIRASADKFFSVIDTIDLSVSDIYKEMHRDLYLTPVVEDGKVIKDSAGNIVRTSIDSLGNDNIENADALKEGQILSTNNILFDFSKSILRAEAYAELDKVARMLKATPTMQVELSAHTDAVGGYSENLKLSEDRAYAAKQYLMSKGIAGDRIISKGYGETTPIGDNKTEIGRQQNRRVEFRILKK
jgi:outer membrane protein OmpA-like peptidoglycan-associated protein